MKDDQNLNEEQFLTLANKAQDEGRLTFVLFEDTDGNWRGGRKIGEKYNFVRSVGPETVLQELLTHDGK